MATCRGSAFAGIAGAVAPLVPRSTPTERSDTTLLAGAYVAEFTAFAAAVRAGIPPTPGPHDARAALRIALACIESVQTGSTVRLPSTQQVEVAR